MKSTSAPEAIAALRDPACYPHPAEPVELIETHISWVFLAGEYAYKVKKPVDLGFLDFSALKMRRFPQEALADSMARRGKLRTAQIDAIAAAIAAFHATIPSAPQDSAFGAPEHVEAPALANFEQLGKLDADPGEAVR